MPAVNQILNNLLNNQQTLASVAEGGLKTSLLAMAKAKNNDELKAAYDKLSSLFNPRLAEGGIDNNPPSLDELRQNARKAWMIYSLNKNKDNARFLEELFFGAMDEATYHRPWLNSVLDFEQAGLIAFSETQKTEIKKVAQEYYIGLLLQHNKQLAYALLNQNNQQTSANILQTEGYPVTNDFTLTKHNLNIAAMSVARGRFAQMTNEQIMTIDINQWPTADLNGFLSDTSRQMLKVEAASRILALALEDKNHTQLFDMFYDDNQNKYKTLFNGVSNDIISLLDTNEALRFEIKQQIVEKIITESLTLGVRQDVVNDGIKLKEALDANNLDAVKRALGLNTRENGFIDKAFCDKTLKPLVTDVLKELQVKYAVSLLDSDDKCLQTLNARHVNDVVTIIGANPLAQKLVTEDNLSTIKEAARTKYIDLKAERLVANRESLLEEIGKSKARVNKLRHVDADEFRGISEKRDLLKRMGSSRFNPAHWFNPAFGAYVRHNAERLEPQFKELATTVSSARDLLLNEKDLLDKLIEKNPPQDLKKSLLNQQKIVNQGLDLYQPVYNNLYGHDGRQGLLSMIEKAKIDQKKQVFFTELGLEAVGQNHKAPQGASQLNAHCGVPPKFYETMNAPAPNTPQVYELKDKNQTIGSFTQSIPVLEQPAPTKMLDGKLVSPTPIQINVNTFPEGNTQTNKLKFAMGIASQLLGNMDGPPTKDNPIVLRGQNAEELKYIWTALMILGQNTPHMRFGPDEVVVRSLAFNPDKELRSKKMRALNFVFDRHSRFADDSLYKQLIDQPNVVNNYLPGMKEMTEDKYGHQSARKAVEKDAKAITNMFKKEAQGGRPAIEVIKDEVQNQGGSRPRA